ncbi:RNA polymerase sigma factor [Robertkochia solimangrovi]|uniref:RNA polymerase sigma factor n=1 Tax=Robertkochia solimangrovi TaxID=2213046 RepID=UPI00117BFC5D|nr:RNA polymerase sigma-70 factor [Robertkochia solimangrovi]TRZ46092.1 RNA polymerase sigma-70 factor [Robertkochia solimangrovi]
MGASNLNKISIPTPTSDKLMVLHLISGNERAFRYLYDKYRPQIYAFSFSLLKNEVLAEEVVQEVFLRIWLHRENLDPNSSFKAFVFTISRNLAFNMLSRASRSSKMKEKIFYHTPVYSPAADRHLEEQDCKRLHQAIIQKLPPKRKTIFTLSREEQKTYEEISHILGISISTVKNQMSKALFTLRGLLRLQDSIL